MKKAPNGGPLAAITIADEAEPCVNCQEPTSGRGLATGAPVHYLCVVGAMADLDDLCAMLQHARGGGVE